MKLKMGTSDKKESAPQVTESKEVKPEQAPPINTPEVKKEQAPTPPSTPVEVKKETANTAPNEQNKTPEVKSEANNKDKKEDVESLRKVIKLDQNNEKKEPEKKAKDPPKEKKEKPAEKPKKEGSDDFSDLIGSSGAKNDDIPEPSSSRESLEQKRAILQSIKDFDFQIKKNQEDIGSLSQKLDSLSKDLDDLVSLYEIVSEQMNPFVGLSKVTKKRFDQLENLMKNIDSLGARIEEIETSFGKTAVQKVVKSENISQNVVSTTPTEISYSNDDIDRIIEMSLGSFITESKIDDLIDQFIEKLKDGNVN